ncbi:DUF6387 family protein [Caballeronia zhejiangensis]|uniref:DUF6387 family protein n=1 Tax=Caballeronia zhejiangensis TaxID=871203 RepID=UPI000A956381|nr:DUF6387 family protein [Caballeronia zhejiangensis]
MKSTLNKLGDLPRQFDIGKYDVTASFSPVDWLVNLEIRVLRKAMFANNLLGDGLDVAERFLDNPIIPAKQGLMDDIGLSKVANTRQVRNVSAFDELSATSWFAPEETRARDYVEAYQRAVAEPSTASDADMRLLFDTPAWKMHQDSNIAPNTEVAALVDLHASEEKVVEDFRQWFRETRAALGIADLKRRFNSVDFDRWHTNRVLAYSDLMFWVEASQRKITNQLIGVALFPDDYDVALADRIRKVVSPLASNVVAEAFTNALRSQILETERKSAKNVPDQNYVYAYLGPTKP